MKGKTCSCETSRHPGFELGGDVLTHVIPPVADVASPHEREGLVEAPQNDFPVHCGIILHVLEGEMLSQTFNLICRQVLAQKLCCSSYSPFNILHNSENTCKLYYL